MLLIFIAGNIFDYSTAPKVMLLLPTIFVLLIALLPETPIYLLRNGKSKSAELSLKFLRGLSERETISQDVNLELQKMITKVNRDETVNQHKSGLSDIGEICLLNLIIRKVD